jgi:hypothetical protein
MGIGSVSKNDNRTRITVIRANSVDVAPSAVERVAETVSEIEERWEPESYVCLDVHCFRQTCGRGKCINR